jgi:hypothetical protein
MPAARDAITVILDDGRRLTLDVRERRTEALAVRRALRAIMRTASDDPGTLLRAAESGTDAGALAEIASGAAAGSAVEALDPEAELVARGARRKAELIALAGGLLSAGEAAARLRISRQAVDKRRRAGRLIAVPRGREHGYPAAQFTDDGLVLGLDDCLGALGYDSPWMRLEWLLVPDAVLGGASPLDALRAGRADDVLAAARGDAE